MFLKKIYQLHVWRKKPVLLCAAIVLPAALLLLLRIMQPCAAYVYEGGHSFTAAMAGDSVALYDHIRLSPGVYEIRLEYEADDSQAYCTVRDGTVFTGGLLTNGTALYSGKSETSYLIWLLEGTDSLQVVVDYPGGGGLTTGGLSVLETNQLWKMLLAILLFFGLIFILSVIAFYYEREYGICREKKQAFFFVALIGLLASVPYLCGYNLAGIDLVYHMYRIEGVKDGLYGGQFPVRIAPEWVYGFGYACPIFYCDIFLYIPAFLRMLGFTVGASCNVYCILLNYVTAWISYYCFGKMFGSRSAGVVCSALYTLSIYRIYKMLITGALGEASALAFMPLVLYGLYRVFSEDPRDRKYKTAWLPIAFGYAGLIQTHVLSCEVTAFVTALVCLFFIKKIFCKPVFLELLKGAAAAAALSAWFLIPFLDYYITQDVRVKHATARRIQGRGGYLAHMAFQFWHKGDKIPSAGNGIYHSYPEGVGLVLVIALAIFVILWFFGNFRKSEDARLPFMKVTAVSGGLLLVMGMCAFPWEWIQFMNPATQALVGSLQFPHRFLGWATVCLVALFGYCMCFLRKKKELYFSGMALLAVFGVMASGMFLLDDACREQDYYEMYNREGMGISYISDGEYLPYGTDASLLGYQDAEAGEGVAVSGYQKHYLHASASCDNPMEKEGYIDFPMLLYKGYHAVNRSSGQELAVTPGDNYQVRVWVPAGFSGDIDVDYVSPVYWRAAECVSVGMAIFLAVYGVKYRRKKYVGQD